MTSFWHSVLWLSPTLLSVTAVSSVSAQAIPATPNLSLDNSLSAIVPAANPTTNDLAQVTSVSQLSDVKPTDWAFQALQSLVERYGCIVGYPNKTYRGNQAMTRYEFAAGLNACMDKIQELLAAATADLVKKEDLLTLQKLQEEFSAELALVRGRVDALEVRTATLEKQQVSTTTKLNGEVVMAVAGVVAGKKVGNTRVQKNFVFGDRVRLNFDTSFTGQDLLRTRIQASNLDSFSQTASGTPQGDLRFASGNDSNKASIDALLYQFPLGEKTTVIVEANAGAADDFTNTVNPYFDGDGGSGALSHFGTRNPIYYLLDGTGVGFRHQFSDRLELSAGYLASDANNPQKGSGLLNGPYGAIAQLTFTPNEKLALGLTYIHAYNNDFSANGSAGSNHSNLSQLNLPFTMNAYGAEASYQINPHLILNGSVGYSQGAVLKGTKGNVNIWNWMVGAAFPDLLRRGNTAGILVGMEPKVTSTSRRLSALDDQDTSLHIEAFYQYRLNDNIAITPGIIWLTAPDHNNSNSDEVIGTVRTTFTF